MPQCRLDMIQYPYSVGSRLMVEMVAKIRLTGLDIVQNPHSIWLLMEVVYHSATVPHTHTHTHIPTHQALSICPPLASQCC